MFLAALFACVDPKPADAAPDPADTAATDSGAPDDTADDTGTDTGPVDTAAAWSPRTVYVSGNFGYDPDLDTFIDWTAFDVREESHLRFDFFDAGGWACVAKIFFPEGDRAPRLEAWVFEDTIEVDGIALDTTLHHTGWSGTPDRVETACPALDPAVWGADNVGDVLLAHDWGVGFGPVRADKAYDASDVLFGGSIYSDVVASGRPPVDAMGYTSVAELDDDGVMRRDIYGAPVLYTYDEVTAGTPPRGLYCVDGATWFDAALLQP